MSLRDHLTHCSVWLLALVCLFSNGEEDSLSLGRRDPWFVVVANRKIFGKPSGKLFLFTSLTWTTPKKLGHLSLLMIIPFIPKLLSPVFIHRFPVDEVYYFPDLQSNLNRVIPLYEGIRVSNCTGMMGYLLWFLLCLKGSFFLCTTCTWPPLVKYDDQQRDLWCHRSDRSSLQSRQCWWHL